MWLFRIACIEIHLCFARLFSCFALNLFETDANNLKWRDTISASHMEPIQVITPYISWLISAKNTSLLG